MSMLLKLAQYAAYAIILVGLVVSAVSIYEGVDQQTRDNILGNVTQDPTKSGDATILFLTYDFLTPSLMQERIGNPETRTWLIEDLPFPSSRDIFFLFFLVWLPILAIGKIWVGSANNLQTTIKRILILILIILAATIVGWIVIKSITYTLMVNSAQNIGIDAITLQNIREMESQHHMDIYGVGGILTLTLVFASIILITLINRRKNA